MSEQASITAFAGQETKLLPEHAWLDRLVGSWRGEVSHRMSSDGLDNFAVGTETVQNLGGLWAVGESIMPLSRGQSMTSIWGIGYDVAENGYRCFMVASTSSHFWKGMVTLSEDGNTMTLDFLGPSSDGENGTANYRDVIEFLDDNHRILTWFGETSSGFFKKLMKVHYYRV